MKLIFEFDELTSPRDAGIAFIGNVRGNLVHDNENERLEMIVPNFDEMKIALREVTPFIKHEA